MRPAWWMLGAALVSSLAFTALPGTEGDVEVLLGMAGPLAVALGTWVLVVRTHRVHPERLTSLMIAGLVAKMVFFGVYVTVMLAVLSLDPAPFVTSFTVYFISLYAIEALCLQRLFASGFSGTER